MEKMRILFVINVRRTRHWVHRIELIMAVWKSHHLSRLTRTIASLSMRHRNEVQRPPSTVMRSMDCGISKRNNSQHQQQQQHPHPSTITLSRHTTAMSINIVMVRHRMCARETCEDRFRFWMMIIWSISTEQIDIWDWKSDEKRIVVRSVALSVCPCRWRLLRVCSTDRRQQYQHIRHTEVQVMHTFSYHHRLHLSWTWSMKMNQYKSFSNVLPSRHLYTSSLSISCFCYSVSFLLFLSFFLRLSDSICLRFVCIGQYSDDSHRSRRTPHPQQHEHHLYHQPQPHHHHHHSSSNGLASDEDDNESSTMFQANYEYTPLKDYAATKNGVRGTGETSSNGLQSKSTRRDSCSLSRQEDNR